MSARNLAIALATALLVAAFVGIVLLAAKLPSGSGHSTAFIAIIPVYTALIPIYIAVWRKRRGNCSRNQDNG